MIVAGFGFRQSASTDSLADALLQARRALCEDRHVSRIATAQDKRDAPAFTGLAQDLQLVPQGVDAETLVAQNTTTQSQASYAAKATGSVAEAAALAAAGQGARLLGPRSVSRDGCATCALAEGRQE